MKFQTTNNIIILLLSFFVAGCSVHRDRILISEIMIALPLNDSSYHYSDDSEININNQKYSLRYKAKYLKGEMIQFTKYATEGAIDYSMEELKNDTAIYRNLDIPMKQNWEIKANSILSSDKTKINLIKLNEFYYKEANGRRIFVIN